MSGEAKAVIDAPPERIYELVSDITRMGEWSPECGGAEWTNGADGPAVGATFNGHNRRNDNEWTTPNTVMVADPGREFSWVVGGPGFIVTAWGFRFTAAGTGTEVTQSFELGKEQIGFRSTVDELPESERAGVIDARREQLIADMRDTLVKLKAVAESG